MPVTVTLVGDRNSLGHADPDHWTNGLAIFNDLSVNVVGTGSTLQVSAAGFLSSTSTSFDVTPATALVVTNTNDSGTGSLRQALIDANANPDTNTITFNIQSAGPYTIQPTTLLPTVTSPIVLDGTTQPGFAGTPIIELSGALAGAGANGLVISGGNSTVRGLVVTRWSNIGIYVHTGGNNVIAGNYVGTDGNGGGPSSRDQATNVLTPNPTANTVGVRLGAPNTRVGGTSAADRNVISGNSTAGLFLMPQSLPDGTVISNATGAVVQGNYFGTDADGMTAKPNGTVVVNAGVPTQITGRSIWVTSPNVTIGGTAPGAGNLISANAIGIDAGTAGVNINGIVVYLSIASSVVIQGNLIGTDVTGAVALPFNVNLNAINIFGRGTGIQIFSPDSIIGGTTPGSGNVISGNASFGIFADDLFRTTGGNSVFGRRQPTSRCKGTRSTNAAGTAALAGSGEYAGIFLTSPNIHIGGTAPSARNIISGNLGTGIQVAGTWRPLYVGALNTLIEGNHIGVDVTGTVAITNRGGGIVVGATFGTFGTPANSSAIIGGTTAASRNIIAGNGAIGSPGHGIPRSPTPSGRKSSETSSARTAPATPPSATSDLAFRSKVA